MSLINDALKRAKAAQQQAPPSPLQLRPAEPDATVRHGVGLILPISLGVTALLILFFVWLWAQSGSVVQPPEIQAQARAPGPAAPEPHAAPAPPPAVTPAGPTPRDGVATNPPAATEPPPEPPAPLKLQGIVFNPTRPSAMINGKTLFVGERIREFRLVAITRNSATLAGAGQTNVLSLDQ